MGAAVTRIHVHLNWEAGATGPSPYLSIARPDQAVERIPLTTSDVARLLADGAYLWSMVEPRRQGEAARGGDLPCFIGAWGE